MVRRAEIFQDFRASLQLLMSESTPEMTGGSLTTPKISQLFARTKLLATVHRNPVRVTSSRFLQKEETVTKEVYLRVLPYVLKP